MQCFTMRGAWTEYYLDMDTRCSFTDFQGWKADILSISTLGTRLIELPY